MKLILERTDEIVTIKAGKARIWNGLTEKGEPVIAIVKAIGFENDRPIGEEELELLANKKLIPAEADQIFDNEVV